MRTAPVNRVETLLPSDSSSSFFIFFLLHYHSHLHRYNSIYTSIQLALISSGSLSDCFQGMDLETLVSVCGGTSSDRKIACESTLDGEDNPTEKTIHPEPHPDSPPQSYWLSKDAEYDWFDRNAFMERKDSSKGNSHSTNLHTNPHSSSNSISQRFSGKLTSKAALLGLPKMETKNRKNCKPGSTRLFPKRSGSVCKSENGSLIEPSSPKVSCMGRVRSKKDRNRRLRNRRRSQSEEKEKPGRSEKPQIGFFHQVRSFFHSNRKSKSVLKSDQQMSVESTSTKTPNTKARDSAVCDFQSTVPRWSVSDTEPPGLGGMKRFTSGRKSDSWVGEVEGHNQSVK